jgi:carbon storage regulator
MLVLSRKKNESVVIQIPPELATGPGMEIKLCVVEIRGDKVRLGFEAPKAVPIHRQEVADVIKKFGRRREAGSCGG